MPDDKPAYSWERFGKRLKECREVMGWSRLKLYQELGWAKGGSRLIYFLEQGKRMPTLERLLDCCRLFGMSPNDFLRSEGEE